MKNEKLDMSVEQKQQITNMLHSQGLSQAEIDVILNGEYEGYESEYDLERNFGGLRKYGDILEKLFYGYTMDELETQGISSQKIEDFNQMLTEKNITIDNAKAIYQYSVDDSMILKVERGTSKETIKNKIIEDLEKSLQKRGASQENIEKMKQFVISSEYEETKLHDNYDIADSYMEQIGLKQNGRLSVKTAMMNMDRYEHIDETIASLKEGVGRTNMSKSMKLYRAVKSSYLDRGLKDGEDLSSLVGKSISNNGQVSTSPLYDSSFAKYDDHDTVFEIYAPKGSRGSYIAELSAYSNTEQEVLLNPNDLYITRAQLGIVDKNGKTKNVLQALCLSKDRECYREIDKKQEISKTNIEQQYKDTIKEQNAGENLPTRQNRFLKFFNQLRAKFLRKDSYTNSQKNENTEMKNQLKPKTQVKEKKSWELEPEEMKRVQIETAKIVKKYKEQIEQQKQVSTQEIQQGDSQKQMQQNQNIQPDYSQPVQDFGGMEL